MEGQCPHGDVVRVWKGFIGYGGAVTPDGRGYVFIDVKGDGENLVRFDLETEQRTSVTHLTGRGVGGRALLLTVG